MTEKQLDARGLGCPQPVILARQALLSAGAGPVQVLVDDMVSVANIQRMAATLGWQAEVAAADKGMCITLTKGEAAPAAAGEPAAAVPRPPKMVVLIGSNLVGTGEEPLGRVLMRAFIKTLKDVAPLPDTMIFINSGVWLTTRGSELIDDLRLLEASGVRLLSCGTCLDYYKRKEDLQVGGVSNMFEIATALVNADRVVRP